MIYGIGTDVVSIERIRQTIERHGAQFAQRILSDAELVQLNEAKDPTTWIAKRWAAKEAFGKAAGIGIRTPLVLQAIGIVNDVEGKPSFELAPAVKAWLTERGITRTHVSISDEREYAIAFVVFET
ncbi:MAG: holo-ACP synthase [Burkholderiales bacterium]|nr:MAG: holo-ACP synthase [Burkholderiales bacterium]TAG80817.1 MAG: holo-ACP synthase [Betaproteobacteria bacterium]